MPPTPDSLRPYIILQTIIGSRAYGLDHADSDTDRRGIYLPPAHLHWSLPEAGGGIPEQIEFKDSEECYWELQKFLTLALKSNPNILECLFSPLVEHATPLAQELLAMRTAFLSKLAHQTYHGYVQSQFKKLSNDLRLHGTLKWAHAMHLIRLLLSGITLLREGRVPVLVPPQYRDQLLAIRAGTLPWDQIDQWRLQLHADFDEALEHTPLPDLPDYQRVNAFLIHARRSML